MQVIVDLVVMLMKSYSTFQKASELESYTQMLFNVKPRILVLFDTEIVP